MSRFGLLTLWVLYLAAAAAATNARMNVLMLISDDLRPEIAAYDNTGLSFYPHMHTPYLDALAGRSLVLKNAYAQQAMCGPSRASLLTGRRPDTTRVYDLATYWRTSGGNFTTLPQYFKDSGYETAGIGKVFHPGKSSGFDDPVSWTIPMQRGRKNFESSDKSWEAIDDALLTGSSVLIDEQIANKAIRTLRDMSAAAVTGDKPFFLAAGFYKPHLPFVFPKSMLDYYPEETIDLPTNPYVPENLPQRAWQKYFELLSYADVSNYTADYNTTLADSKVRELRRAYFASVTWVDSQIGRVLDELETLGLANNTVVAFLGDHGFQLGEHAQWCKSTNFELATRVPLMVHVPGLTDCGVQTEELVELVDIFPTLVQAAGLVPVQRCGADSPQTDLCSEGTSLLPLVTVPSAGVKSASFSQTPRKYFKLMGYTMRTKEFRYTEWVNFNFTTSLPDWDTPDMQRELYDHRTDSEENFNIVEDEAAIAAELSLKLREGWRQALTQ